MLSNALLTGWPNLQSNCGAGHKRVWNCLYADAPALSAYVDAAFADNPGCRSTAGWVYFVQGCVVAYDSHTIKRVVTSSTEAECAALTIVGKENTWQRQMYSDLMGISGEFPPTPIFGDNTASISMISSGVTKRGRHFSIDWFKFRDLKDQSELTVILGIDRRKSRRLLY